MIHQALYFSLISDVKLQAPEAPIKALLHTFDHPKF